MESVQVESSVGRFVEKQRKNKNAGKAYLNRDKVQMIAKIPPKQEVGNFSAGKFC